MTRSSRSSARSLALALAGGAAGALLGYGVARWAAQHGTLRPLLDALGPADLLALPLIYLLVIAVHELGHLAGGISRGMRFLILIVGPFRLTRTVEGLRFDWFWNAGTLGGLAAALPDPAHPAEPQLRRLILGGPLASLLLAALGVAVTLAFEGRIGAYGTLVAAFSSLIFLLTATPFRAGGFLSDGMQYLEMLRGGESVRVRVLLTGLIGQSMGGTRPGELDAGALQQALDSPDREPLRRLSTALLAYLHAWDRGDIATAGQHLDEVEAGIDQYPDGFRQSLAIELSLFAALERGHGAGATTWLARAKGGVVDAARRSLAEGAVHWLQGDSASASAKVRQGLSQLPRSSDPGLAAMTRVQLQRLQSRIESTAPVTSRSPTASIMPAGNGP